MANEKIGKSVGVIVRNEKDEYLVLWRLKEPTGLALPAGHLEEWELPEECAKRELFEETGLKAASLRKVFSGYIPTEYAHCGHTAHNWNVYEATAEGEPILGEPEKHKFVKFMSIEEMKPYIKAINYDSAWFKHILPALGII